MSVTPSAAQVLRASERRRVSLEQAIRKALEAHRRVAVCRHRFNVEREAYHQERDAPGNRDTPLPELPGYARVRELDRAVRSWEHNALVAEAEVLDLVRDLAMGALSDEEVAHAPMLLRERRRLADAERAAAKRRRVT